MQAIKCIGVVGAGQMGSGIAQVFAASGFDVTLSDKSDEMLARAKAGIAKSAQKLQEKGKISQDAFDNIGRIVYTTTLADLKDANLIVEAIIEDKNIKMTLFKELDTVVDKSAVFASNTSSIPITQLAAATSRPEKFVGMHFMNPVPIMKLVELIPGMATSDETLQLTMQLCEKLGKTHVVSKDFPGFIVNRILMPMINDAFNVLMEGVATARDIDAGMTLGTNQPMGPLTLADFIGLDTCLSIMEVMYQGTYDPKYRPSPLLRKYVEAGYFGKKTGRGVYEYERKQ